MLDRTLDDESDGDTSRSYVATEHTHSISTQPQDKVTNISEQEGPLLPIVLPTLPTPTLPTPTLPTPTLPTPTLPPSPVSLSASLPAVSTPEDKSNTVDMQKSGELEAAVMLAAVRGGTTDNIQPNDHSICDSDDEAPHAETLLGSTVEESTGGNAYCYYHHRCLCIGTFTIIYDQVSGFSHREYREGHISQSGELHGPTSVPPTDIPPTDIPPTNYLQANIAIPSFFPSRGDLQQRLQNLVNQNAEVGYSLLS